MSYFQQDKILVICEAGKNFIVSDKPSVEQCLNEAKNLARIAKKVGGDCVKFQTHVFEDEQYHRHVNRHEWIKKNEELTPYEEFWVPLKKYCDEIGIVFMTTPMSILAAQKVEDLVTVWKVSSPDLTNANLRTHLCNTGKPIIISTGMSTKKEVEQAVKHLKRHGADFAVLHCTSIYPCPTNKLNLSHISALVEGLNDANVVGFSDHSTSLTVPVLAIRKGARIIEKHFTIDKNSTGPDHAMSLDFEEMQKMIRNIRITEEELFAYGDGVKRVYPEEEEKKNVFRV